MVVEIGEINMQQLVGVADLGDVRVNFGKASCRVYFDKSSDLKSAGCFYETLLVLGLVYVSTRSFVLSKKVSQ